MPRVLQISDSHLSSGKPHFAANWPPLRRWIEAQDAALVVHTGDVTVDGADQEEDMEHGAAMLHALNIPVMALPGNHDVGEAGHPHQPVDGLRLARWRRHFGQDHWLRDVGDWRLIGLNSMLFGEGGPEEAAQRAWLDQAMAGAGGRPVAWFMHQPLFIADPDEPDTGYWSVKPEPRRDLLALARRSNVRLIASGHLHKAHHAEVAGVHHVWCPASGFLVGAALQPELAGDARLGAVILDLEGPEVSVTVSEVPGLQDLWIDDVIHEVYPPRQAA
ncbi:metallophosphoesterase family protein [Geminicoccus harenae]|uniref:metallophosphoesterase family protein n=1 Tax=Geminicoccus harenae TaxID=2498453 RepID=UPI00168B77D7|nr:metallophosphoesterase family protein [Geminicoccus harenae]